MFNSQYSRAIDIISFDRLSQNSIADTMNWFLNSLSNYFFLYQGLSEPEFYGEYTNLMKMRLELNFLRPKEKICVFPVTSKKKKGR